VVTEYSKLLLRHLPVETDNNHDTSSDYKAGELTTT